VTLSVVIPTHDRRIKVLRLLRSLHEGWLPDRTQIIVVADRCSDGTRAAVAGAYPDVEVIEPAPAPPGRTVGGGVVARQAGAARATGAWLLFVDDDNVVDPDCVRRLLDAAAREPGVGVIGPLMFNDENLTSVWCAGAVIGRFGLVRNRSDVLVDLARPELSTPCTYLPNAFLVHREVLLRVPFDPASFPHNWGELEWGVRVAAAGYQIRVAVDAKIWHDHGYGGPTTRISSAWAYDQARARILARRRFPKEIGSLPVFFLTVFPASTLVYLRSFTVLPDRWAATRAYFLGTWAGLRDPLPPPPSS
jgi:GT2 family glycosyltransferase